MKKITFIIAFALSLCTFSSIAQTSAKLVGKIWTDYTDFYKVTNQGTQYAFTGGTEHEGGYGFILQPLSGTSFVLKTLAHGDDTYSIIAGEVGSKVEYKTFGDQQWLIFYNATGDAIGSLVGLDNPSDDFTEFQYTHYIFAGSYTDTHGNEYSFIPDVKKTEGFGSSTYTIEKEFEMPSSVITFGKGQSYRVKPTASGLTIYAAVNSGDEVWNDKGVKYTLRWNEEASAGKTGVHGRFPFTSLEVAPLGVLNFYPKDLLKIMRNEIFARHGYIFTSTAMKTYFEKQGWYHPTTSDINEVTSQLSEIETINVALIRQAEKNQD